MKKSRSSFFLKIRSRHPSAKPLRQALKFSAPAVYRHGSTTTVGSEYEINSINSVQCAASKFKMKAAFARNGVKTAEWFFPKSITQLDQVVGLKDDGNVILKSVELKDMAYPLIAKRNMGSRGEGMVKIDNQEQLTNFLKTKVNGNSYYFERFYSFSREYRLHIDSSGCFYTCRKVLKEETPGDKRWYRNDSNCNWIREENPLFDRPINWSQIEAECVKALKATGLDVGACDLKVQSAKTEKDKKREEPDFIVIEINSAPSFGEITMDKYKEQLPKILHAKYGITRK